MSTNTYGFIGLGNMGGPIAANIAEAGFDLVAYDQAGTQARAPQDAVAAASTARVAEAAETVFLSLPDGDACLAVAEELAAPPGGATTAVIDLSTIGIEAAREIHLRLADAGIAYADAPVSGGTAGAQAATVTVMWGGPKALLEEHRAALEAMSANVFHVGDAPGQGQAMKLLNNFLSATAMVATSEAVVFGAAQGLDMKIMLDVLNVSTGRNTATSDKFPNRILTGAYDAGFFTALLTKDVRLYMESVGASGTPSAVGDSVLAVWRAADEAMPGSDFTRVFEFVRDKG